MANRYRYAIVSRGSTPLAEYPVSISPSIRTLAQKIISKADNTETNLYKSEEGDNCVCAITDQINLVYLVICGPKVTAKDQVEFVNKLKEKWVVKYGTNVDSLGPNSKNAEFGQTEIKSLIDQFNAQVDSKLQQTQEVLIDANERQKKNLDLANARGESLHELQSKSQKIEEGAHQFVINSIKVRQKICWQKYRMYFFIAVMVILVIFVIVVIACGGFTFRRC